MGHPTTSRSIARLQGSYDPREYCVQYNETDLAFLSRLMEHEGIFWFWEHESGSHKLVLCDTNDKLKPRPGSEKLPWGPDRRGTFAEGDHFVEWRPQTVVRPGRFAHTDYDFERPSADLMSKSADPKKHTLDGSEVYEYPGAYIVHARGDTLAGVRLESVQAPHSNVLAKGVAFNLAAGCTFTFEEFPRQLENGEYIVTRVTHKFVEPGGRDAPPEGQIPGASISQMELAPMALPFRPPRVTPRPVMRGPQTAKVVGPAGQEIFTDKYARVKVQFHWDREGKQDEDTTCFIRVSQTWAGAGWGFIQIPRIGQEVIVDFLEGDPDQPIITGRVYNAEQMPPYGLPANATQSGWKSNSSPGGGGWNELRFEDKAGSEEVYFQAQKDHNELIKNNESRTIGNDFAESVGHDATQDVENNRTETVGVDKSTSVGSNRTVSIGVNDTETVGSNRSLTVGADETISVGASSTETIGLNHTQTVAVAQTVTVGAARIDTVGASETRTVGSDQAMTIGSGRTVTVGASQTHSVGADDATTVGGNQNLDVGGAQSISTGGAQSISVGAAQELTVASSRMVEVGGDNAMKVSGGISVTAGKKVVVEAADEITLKTGDATIQMKKDGTIVIKGKDITVDGSGKIQIKAGGDVKIKGSKIHQN